MRYVAIVLCILLLITTYAIADERVIPLGNVIYKFEYKGLTIKYYYCGVMNSTLIVKQCSISPEYKEIGSSTILYIPLEYNSTAFLVGDGAMLTIKIYPDKGYALKLISVNYVAYPVSSLIFPLQTEAQQIA